ncbi:MULTISPECIES: hypothetical protein [Microbacterium]|uniref:Uncharacterized protein n=1 Tax=Microbacterium barkeri TaxID=33917 RepID=A0A9W6H0L7_9MICO|nr:MULTISPECIES: hypothetical protein [Microbacterium]MDI6942342.1 hypothetical protein [Microbacterium barkeri]MDR6876215.1 hypothetical protein [Microbacterium barkeri]WRH17286.1 hypothetical protein GC092_07005 [Microbacterium sp. JZ37]GLJ60332.1 hypothetical protein GCM10017576_04610 [Microbacterium barkeri]
MSNAAALIAIPLATPRLARARARLTRAGASLWRVVGLDERVAGHLRAVESELGMRYRAERFHPASGALLPIGEFWTPDEAVETLLLSR